MDGWMDGWLRANRLRIQPSTATAVQPRTVCAAAWLGLASASAACNADAGWRERRRVETAQGPDRQSLAHGTVAAEAVVKRHLSLRAEPGTRTTDDVTPGADVGGVSPVPTQMWAAVSPVPAQMWAGQVKSRRRGGRIYPSPVPLPFRRTHQHTSVGPALSKSSR